MIGHGPQRTAVSVARRLVALAAAAAILPVFGCASSVRSDNWAGAAQTPENTPADEATEGGPLIRATPGVPGDLRTRLQQYGRVVDGWSAAAEMVAFQVEDMAVLEGVELIVVDERVPSGNSVSAERIPLEKRWITAFLVGETIVSRGVEGYPDDMSLVEAEMLETGAALWKQRIELEGLAGIAWSFGDYEVQSEDGTPITIVVPNSLVAWSVDGITTTIRSERVPYEDLLPLAHNLRAAQIRVR